MPPIEIGPVRPVFVVDTSTRRAVAQRESAPAPAAATASKPAQALDPGVAPIDAERVAAIRKAIEQGRYPVIPARIADAVIAAGLLLRTDS